MNQLTLTRAGIPLGTATVISDDEATRISRAFAEALAAGHLEQSHLAFDPPPHFTPLPGYASVRSVIRRAGELFETSEKELRRQALEAAERLWSSISVLDDKDLPTGMRVTWFLELGQADAPFFWLALSALGAADPEPARTPERQRRAPNHEPPAA